MTKEEFRLVAKAFLRAQSGNPVVITPPEKATAKELEARGWINIDTRDPIFNTGHLTCQGQDMFIDLIYNKLIE